MSTRKVLSEAMKLKPDDRLIVARELFDSVEGADDADFELSPDLELEVERRLQFMDAHPEKCIPFDQVEKELDALMRKDARKRK